MSTTRIGSSSGDSAVDRAGSEQQGNPSADVDPTNEPIDVPVPEDGIFWLNMLRCTFMFAGKELQ